MNATEPKSGHTPGPWTVEASGRDRTSRAVAGAHGHGLVCHLYEPRDQADANARLIAAAPDLLAELEKIVDRWALRDAAIRDCNLDPLPVWEREQCEAARAAIAKARGAEEGN